MEVAHWGSDHAAILSDELRIIFGEGILSGPDQLKEDASSNTVREM
jgi:hypothetical protein